MKKLLFVFALFTLFLMNAQGRSISWGKKSKAPVELISGDSLKVGQPLLIAIGSNQDRSYKFVQFLNGMNEPIKPADSRATMKKQKNKFFKTQDDVLYVFTKYFVINIEAALRTKEVEVVKEKRL